MKTKLPSYSRDLVQAMIAGFDVERYDKVIGYRDRFEELFELASQPVKFPARRRREDRVVPRPKAA